MGYGISAELEKAIKEAMKSDWKTKQDIADIAGCSSRTVQESRHWKGRTIEPVTMSELASINADAKRHGHFHNKVHSYDSPIDDLLIVANVADIHKGSVGCKDNRFDTLVNLTKKEKRLKIIGLGDWSTNVPANFRSADAVYEQTLTPQQQLEWLSNKVSELGDDLLWWWLGNHERRSQHNTGMDLPGWVVHKLGVPVMNGPNMITINVGKQSYKGILTHELKRSVVNPFHGPMKLYRSTRDKLDFCGGGHLHQKALGQIEDCWLFCTGSDECEGTVYGEMFGNNIIPCYPTMVFHGDKHKAMLFGSVSDALQYARSLKTKVIRYVGDI